jgi:hypothetical protein
MFHCVYDDCFEMVFSSAEDAPKAWKELLIFQSYFVGHVNNEDYVPESHEDWLSHKEIQECCHTPIFGRQDDSENREKTIQGSIGLARNPLSVKDDADDSNDVIRALQEGELPNYKEGELPCCKRRELPHSQDVRVEPDWDSEAHFDEITKVQGNGGGEYGNLNIKLDNICLELPNQDKTAGLPMAQVDETAMDCVVTNLTFRQKFLLQWHIRLGHIVFGVVKWITREWLNLRARKFVSDSVKLPKYVACSYGQELTPTAGFTVKPEQKLNPGDLVESSLPGRFFSLHGNTELPLSWYKSILFELEPRSGGNSYGHKQHMERLKVLKTGEQYAMATVTRDRIYKVAQALAITTATRDRIYKVAQLQKGCVRIYKVARLQKACMIHALLMDQEPGVMHDSISRTRLLKTDPDVPSLNQAIMAKERLDKQTVAKQGQLPDSKKVLPDTLKSKRYLDCRLSELNGRICECKS